MFAIRTILYPTDFSRCSDYAFCVACALARDYNARLIIMHVHPPPVAMGEFGVIPDYVDPETLKERLARFHPEFPAERLVVAGEPTTEIVRVAADHGADLIVMGSHGRAGLSRLLLGSVAEAVLRKAPCPVLNIKAPAHEVAPMPREKETIHA
jgi:nucleotide-binding universal stress UspA family protein